MKTRKRKQCGTCKRYLGLDKFGQNKDKLDGLSYKCKECTRAYNRIHYANNIDYYLLKARKHEAAYKKWWFEYKSKLKCCKCGYKKCVVALDFHHRDPSKKSFDIGKAIAQQYRREKVLAEIKKCDVLCANCHREYHYYN